MRQHADEELIRQTLSGSEAAFAELVRRHQRRVAVTVRSVIGGIDQEDLADTVQEIFLLVARGLGSFRGEAQFATWLTRIALRHCYREARRRRRRQMIFRPQPQRDAEREPAEARLAGDDRADGALVAEERRRAVVAAMERLPEEFRTVLALRIVEEMPVEEVAAALGISTGTVKSRLFRAKEKMRELLAGTGLALEFETRE